MRITSTTVVLSILGLGLSGPSLSQPTSSKPAAPKTAVSKTGAAQPAPKSNPEPKSNSEMSRMFAADQAARQDPATIDWAVVAGEDAARLKRTRALLDAGALSTGEDFYHAAFIFQHGGEAGSYLLAHSLTGFAKYIIAHQVGIALLTENEEPPSVRRRGLFVLCRATTQDSMTQPGELAIVAEEELR